jgi:hypothetical protein
MAVIVSKHKGPLGLPRGPVLRPGVETNIDQWPYIKNHAVVKAWLASGVLSVVGEEQGEPEPVDPPEGDGAGEGKPAAEVDEELEKLRSEAKELGIAPHWRWSKETLREKIDAKLAE